MSTVVAKEKGSIDSLTVQEFEARKNEFIGQEVQVSGILGSNDFPDNYTLPESLKVTYDDSVLNLGYKNGKKNISDPHMVVNLMSNIGQQINMSVYVCEKTRNPMLVELRLQAHSGGYKNRHHVYKF